MITKIFTGNTIDLREISIVSVDVYAHSLT